MPYKYGIPNTFKEVHLKILQNIYPCNSMLSTFVDIHDICVFCKKVENLTHLFYECKSVIYFGENLTEYLFTFLNTTCLSLHEGYNMLLMQ